MNRAKPNIKRACLDSREWKSFVQKYKSESLLPQNKKFIAFRAILVQ